MTNKQSNAYSIGNVNNLDWRAMVDFVGHNLSSVLGAISIPSTSTQYQVNGLMGAVLNNSPKTNAVGMYTVVVCNVFTGEGQCWGENPAVGGNPIFRSNLVGSEVDLNSSRSDDSVFGVGVQGRFTGDHQNATAVAYNVIRSEGSSWPWAVGYATAIGGATYYGVAGEATAAKTAVGSQILAFANRDAAGAEHFTNLFADAHGNLYVKPGGDVGSVPSGVIVPITDPLPAGDTNQLVLGNIDDLDVQREFAAVQGGKNMTSAFTGAAHVSSGSKAYQVNGVSGFVNASSASSNSVALYGQARPGANDIQVWSLNTVVDDAGFACNFCVGYELDDNVGNVNSTGSALAIQGVWTAQPTDAAVNAIIVGINNNTTSSSPYKYGAAFTSTAGAAYFSLVSQPLSKVTSVASPSQSLLFDAQTGSNSYLDATVFLDTTGALDFRDATAYNFSAGIGVTGSLTAHTVNAVAGFQTNGTPGVTRTCTTFPTVVNGIVTDC